MTGREGEREVFITLAGCWPLLTQLLTWGQIFVFFTCQDVSDSDEQEELLYVPTYDGLAVPRTRYYSPLIRACGRSNDCHGRSDQAALELVELL